MKPELLQGFYLGDVRVEPLKGQISGPGISAHLAPKAAEVLLQLAAQPGSLVTRDFLIGKVWGESSGTPEALSHAVSEIRHALQDSAANPRFIQTLPRRGYRLILEPVLIDDHTSSVVIGANGDASIEQLGFFENLQQRGVLEAALAYLIVGWLIIQVADVVFGQLLLPQWAGTFVTILVLAGFPIVLALSWFLEFRDGRAVLDTGPQLRNRRERFSRTYLSVLGALAIASVLVFLYDQAVGLPEENAPAAIVAGIEEDLLPVEPNSIAVLRFLNIDGSEETEIFASGFAEEMINRLARLPTMSVSSRGDAWSLGPTSSSEDVRRRLRVAYYVEGSVRLLGEKLRVNVKLIDSMTGFQLSSRSFEESIEDFNQVQQDITDVTFANLRIALPAGAHEIFETSYEEADLDAYILYRRGKETYEEPRTTDSLEASIALYRQALSFDAEYAAAHAGLCSAYVALFELTNAAADISSAEAACAAALTSNSRLYMVYGALGDLYRLTGRIDNAEEAYQRALAINSRDVHAMGGLALVYRRTQRVAEAESLLHEAIETQPGNWRAINQLGTFQFMLGNYDKAAEAYRQVVFLDPENFQARSNLGSALTMAGEFEAGRVVFEEALAIRPIQRTYSNLGVIYYYLGEFDKSVATHQQAVELSPGQALMWLNLGDSLHFAGQADEASAAFAQARQLSRDALRVDSSDSEAIVTLAWSQHMLGESDEALETAERGIATDPADPYGYYYDALIRYNTGDEAAALESLATALELGYPPGLLVAEPYLGDMRANDEFHAIIVDSIN